MRTDFDYGTSRESQRLADLKHRAEELERQLSDARTSLQRELGQFGYEHPPRAGADHGFPGDSPGGYDGTAALGGIQVPAGTGSYLEADGDCGPGGFGAGGYGAEGFSADGYSADGYVANGHSANGHSANGHSADGQGADGHSADGQGADGHSADGFAEDHFGDAASPAQERTEALVSKGRSTASRPKWSMLRGKWIALAAAALALLVAVLLLTLTGGSASWPASVATVQREVARACQNPDVKSEPGQVNFACGKDTRQILWVFALMTSANNPKFADNQTGRVGLEPITASQGGQLAWSLNLHHPYDPFSPIDSLAVAARAINNIIGGATVTGTNGNPVVQPGLENDPTNCLRYTGSAAVTSRKGFPGLCAKPITTTAGQSALVADVFQKWIVGAAPQSAQDAAVLFANAKNPGDPRVQAILKHLPTSKPLA